MTNFKRLDGESRFYDIVGVGKFPSVTTILGVIAKPALIPWAQKEVANAIQPILQDVFDHKIAPKDLDVDAILKMARNRPKAIMEEAGDIGTQVHKALEIIVNEKIANPDLSWEHLHERHHTFPDERIEKCVGAFFKWAREHDFVPLESELMVYSKKIGYAGTFDAVGYVNGVLTVVDWKSSKAYYDEMGIQLSAYRHAYSEMTGKKKVDGMMVLRLGKLDGEFEVIKVTSPAKNMLAFKAALELWKWKQSNSKRGE